MGVVVNEGDKEGAERRGGSDRRGERLRGRGMRDDDDDDDDGGGGGGGGGIWKRFDRWGSWGWGCC